MDMPWAACALGANRPMTMNTTVKTSPYSRHRPSAASPSAALEGSRKPNPNPSAAVKMMDQPLVVKSASVRPVTRLIGDDVRDGIGQAAVIGHFGVGGAKEGDALLEQGIDIQLAGLDGGLGGELGKSADAAFEGLDLIDHDLGGLFDEGAVGFVVAGHHLFDGEADGGEGILDLVGHLAGEGLPTGELAEVDEALGALLELVGHMVEGLDGAADFVVAGGGDAGGEVAGGQSGKAGGQLLDGAADAVGHVDQQGPGSEPKGGV